MKRILLLFAAVVTFGLINVNAQDCASKEKSCCATSANKTFTALADDAEFVESHQNPGNFQLEDPKGLTIKFNTPNGDMANGYLLQAEGDEDDWVFVFHEWYGLNDYIKRESERLFEELENEVNVLAIDLYDGSIATNREEAAKLMQSVTDERAFDIIQGAINLAGNEAEIATLGWCYGGGWALQAAIELGERAEAVVMYYGMPEEDEQRLQMLEAPVLGIFGKQDKNITPGVVAAFEKRMNERDKEITIEMYDAGHAFANPSNEVYDEEATEDAWKKAVEFLDDHL